MALAIKNGPIPTAFGNGKVSNDVVTQRNIVKPIPGNDEDSQISPDEECNEHLAETTVEATVSTKEHDYMSDHKDGVLGAQDAPETQSKLQEDDWEDDDAMAERLTLLDRKIERSVSSPDQFDNNTAWAAACDATTAAALGLGQVDPTDTSKTITLVQFADVVDDTSTTKASIVGTSSVSSFTRGHAETPFLEAVEESDGDWEKDPEVGPRFVALEDLRVASDSIGFVPSAAETDPQDLSLVDTAVIDRLIVESAAGLELAMQDSAAPPHQGITSSLAMHGGGGSDVFAATPAVECECLVPHNYRGVVDSLAGLLSVPSRSPAEALGEFACGASPPHVATSADSRLIGGDAFTWQGDTVPNVSTDSVQHNGAAVVTGVGDLCGASDASPHGATLCGDTTCASTLGDIPGIVSSAHPDGALVPQTWNPSSDALVLAAISPIKGQPVQNVHGRAISEGDDASLFAAEGNQGGAGFDGASSISQDAKAEFLLPRNSSVSLGVLVSLTEDAEEFDYDEEDAIEYALLVQGEFQQLKEIGLDSVADFSKSLKGGILPPAAGSSSLPDKSLTDTKLVVAAVSAPNSLAVVCDAASVGVATACHAATFGESTPGSVFPEAQSFVGGTNRVCHKAMRAPFGAVLAASANAASSSNGANSALDVSLHAAAVRDVSASGSVVWPPTVWTLSEGVTAEVDRVCPLYPSISRYKTSK